LNSNLLDSTSPEAAIIRLLLFGSIDVSATNDPGDNSHAQRLSHDGGTQWSDAASQLNLNRTVVAPGFFQIQTSTMVPDTPAEQVAQLLGEHLTVGAATVVSSSVTMGYVIWMLRGGSLLTAFLSSMPAWQVFDPLPVLHAAAGRAYDDDESLLTLVTRKARTVIRQRRGAELPDGPELTESGNS
jgi:hypothetical protein